MHPAESGEMVDSDSDPDPTPMASLQPEGLDETVVAEEEQGEGQTQLLGLGISSGKTKAVPVPASGKPGLEASAHSSDYHSLNNASGTDFGKPVVSSWLPPCLPYFPFEPGIQTMLCLMHKFIGRVWE